MEGQAEDQAAVASQTHSVRAGNPLARLCKPFERQLSLPHGWLAPVAARMLNRANRPLIQSAIDLLAVQPGDRVLEVGFGGGLSLAMLLDEVGAGQVLAIEPSPEMVRRARRMHATEVQAGRLVVEVARADDIPAADASVDRVLSVQTIFFWGDTQAGLAEVRRVLVPGGRLALAVMPEEIQVRFGFGNGEAQLFGEGHLVDAVNQAGFDDVEARDHPRGTILVAGKP
jgi:arsenite methyltransferase